MTTVVFDLDDTLYKERDYVASGFRAVADEIAAESGIEAKRLLDVMSGADNAFDALRDYLASSGADVPDTGRLLDIYRTHRPAITLPYESRRVLDTLKDRGFRLVLITDGRSVGQRNKIEALGLYPYFAPDAIIISEENGGDKTTDIPYRILSERFPDSSNMVFAGDNTAKDFRWGNLNGAMTVMLRDKDGTNVHRQDMSIVPAYLRPRMTIDNLSRLLTLNILNNKCQQL